jgi:hypothetical protein
VANTAPTTTGDVLTWNVTNNRWQPGPGGGGGITSITFATPLTGGTISTSGQTVGLTVPSADLLGGNGSIFGSVTVGTGLSITGTFPTRTLVATASGGNVTAGTLTLNQLVLGGGGQAIGTLGTPGTATTVLHGNNAGQPTFGIVNLATDVGTSQLQAGSLGNGTGANTTNFLRGDMTWAPPPGGSSGVVASLQFQLPYYATAGSVASVQGHPALTTTTGGSLMINRNPAALPAALGTTGLWVRFNDISTDTNPTVLLDTQGSSPTLAFRMTGSTGGTPAATGSANSLGGVSWRGYDGANYSGAVGTVIVQAAQGFTSARRAPG